MTRSTTRNVEHEISVSCPADTLYEFVANVAHWPQVFPPTIHVEQRGRSDTEERIQIWATANGEAKTWTSLRRLDPVARRIEFRQEVSQPPVRSMGGVWVIEAVSDSESHVRLLHDYSAIDDDREKLAWLDQAVDRNSTAELKAMKANAERLSSGSAFTFEDSVQIDGPAGDAYDFVNEAGLWKERLPHVARVVLDEETLGLQMLEMDTMTKDGSVHTTKSVRVCFPRSRIVYKQIVLPALMTLHTGEWLFEDEGDGAIATSRHTVAIDENAVVDVLGEGATLDRARTFVHDALSANSLATLAKAKDYAESRP